MSTPKSVVRDERTVAVENASYKWAYYFLVWPLVIDALYRQKVRNEEVGDLIALVCASGAIGLVYLIIHKAWVSRWPWSWRRTVIVFAVCIVVAVLVLSIALFP